MKRHLALKKNIKPSQPFFDMQEILDELDDRRFYLDICDSIWNEAHAHKIYCVPEDNIPENVPKHVPAHAKNKHLDKSRQKSLVTSSSQETRVFCDYQEYINRN